MKTLSRNIIFLLAFLAVIPLVRGYTNLTPEEVHARLVRRDTLLLLDVREIHEYHAGHIAEPAGQLPLTPTNLPWSSNVLFQQFSLLPKNIDIIVSCRSGARSAAASTFLESKGYTRIFNMLGGFLSWPYEQRTGGYGDNSGQWVHSTDPSPVSITCVANGDTSKIILPSQALPGIDSLYFELHFASNKFPIPPDVPKSNIEGLFRLTILDQFGLSQFVNDSLQLNDSAALQFYPNYRGADPGLKSELNMTVFVPSQGWKSVAFNFNPPFFNRSEVTLKRWYNVEALAPSGVAFHFKVENYDVQVYPNPFNSSVKIIAEPSASISIYDIQGRFVDLLDSPFWLPDKSLKSGMYFIKINSAEHRITKRVVYLK